MKKVDSTGTLGGVNKKGSDANHSPKIRLVYAILPITPSL